MMNFQYKVIPFIGQARGTLSPTDVARQLEIMINSNASSGWEFYQLSDVNVEIQPGCLGSIFGAKVQYARFDQLIFRTSVESNDRPGVLSEQASKTVNRAQGSTGVVPELKTNAHPKRSVTSNHIEIWRQKTDDEILSAAAKPQDYTEEGRAMIRAEIARRSLNQTAGADTGVLHDEEQAESGAPDEYCYHCGSDVAIGSKRCESCGKNL